MESFTRPRFGWRRVLGVACASLWLLPALSAASPQQDSGLGRLREEARREGWQRVPEILVAVGAEPGARIADVGSGDGFFTVRLARAVGRAGRVTAVDLSAEALDRLRRRLTDEGLSNVDVLQGDAADTDLPAESLDAILIVNAYHEMARYQQTLARLRTALKPGGRLVLVEPLDPKLRREPRDRQTRAHSLSAGFAVGEVRSSGFDVVALQDPFASLDDTEYWLLVARRSRERVGASTGQPHPDEAGVTPGPPATPPGVSRVGTDAEIASEALRIGLDDVKRLLARDGVLLIDVRDREAYEHGHLPGAILVSLDSLADRLDALRAVKQRIVVYCS